tara:strand:+ start:11645 stop:11884 length:240 start_codon:yes stop_codon:yes gene_type:complete
MKSKFLTKIQHILESILLLGILVLVFWWYKNGGKKTIVDFFSENNMCKTKQEIIYIDKEVVIIKWDENCQTDTFKYKKQ